jgi:hypothetical protein
VTHRGCRRQRLNLMMFAALAAIAITPARAQTCHSVAGSWKLVENHGIVGAALSFDPYFAITDIRLTTQLAGAEISQAWEFSGPHLSRTTHYQFRADATRRTTGLKDPRDFEYVALAAQWQNCTLIQTGYSLLFGLEVATRSSYVLSADGQELTILQSGESPISVVERQLLLRKVTP